MKGSSTILKERNERQPHPGRTNRAGRSGRGRGRGMQSGSSKKREGTTSGQKAATNPYNQRKMNNNNTKKKESKDNKCESRPSQEKIKEWDDLTLMNELINQLNQQLPIITDKQEKEECLNKIHHYTERFEALKKTDSKTILEEVQNKRNRNKKETNKNTNDDNIDWNNMECLNRELKEHEVSLAKEETGNKKEISHLQSMVEIFKIRIQTLLDTREQDLQQTSPSDIKNPPVDYKRINEFSTIALKHGNEWDDLSFVHTTILEIAIEKIKEKDPAQRDNMGRITDMYLVRKEMLLQEMVAHDEEKIKNGEIEFEYNNKETYSNNDSTNVQQRKLINSEEIENGKQDEDKKTRTRDSEMINEYNEVIRIEMDDETSRASDTSMSLAESATGVITLYNESQSTASISIQPNQASESHRNQQKPIYTTTSKKQKQQKTYSAIITQSDDNGIQNTDKNCIRLRVQFKAQKPKGATKLGDQIRQFLHDLIISTKTIDSNSKCHPWLIKSTLAPLHGKEILLLSADSIVEYIAIPKKVESLANGKRYYNFGIRLETNLAVESFAEQWNNQKYYQQEHQPWMKWAALKPSEMQSASSAYAIGYFLGSTERGEYTTLKANIAALTNVNTELSFQTVYQHEISQKYWGIAKEKANNSDSNPNGKLHKKVLYLNSPSALIAYVDKRENIKTARRKLFDLFGTLTEQGDWPVVSDGSRMRFVPIMKNDLKTTEAMNRLDQAMKKHTELRARESFIDLGIQDILEPKEYLNNSSLEVILHGLQFPTSSSKQIPVIKHITRKWQKDATIIRYQAAVQEKLQNNAQEIIMRLEETLTQQYGESVRTHFPW